MWKILVLGSAVQASIDCFPYKQVYGGQTSGAMVASDLSYLRGDSFNEEMRLSKLEVCGQSMSFSGIQAILSDSAGNEMHLN